MICNECKKDIPDDTRFCPWCGSKVWIQVEEEKKYSDEAVIQVTPKQEQPKNIQNLSYEEPVSVKEWVITSLIMMIPIVNIVMFFVWAFSGKEKKSKSNYFKAALIMSGIVIVFSIALSIIIFVLGSASMDYALQKSVDDSVAMNINSESIVGEMGGIDDNDYEDMNYDYNNYYNNNYYDDYYDYEGEDEDYEDDYYDEDENDNTGLDEEDYDYILPDSDTEKLTDGMAKSLSKSDIRLAINEIYARHGRRFDDKSLQEYFDEKRWYSGTVDAENFDESVFNKIEKYNIRLLSKYR